jgi:hypothetical protein
MSPYQQIAERRMKILWFSNQTFLDIIQSNIKLEQLEPGTRIVNVTFDPSRGSCGLVLINDRWDSIPPNNCLPEYPTIQQSQFASALKEGLNKMMCGHSPGQDNDSERLDEADESIPLKRIDHD